jgi:4-hydroxy 2-oxovalerate aldolase
MLSKVKILDCTLRDGGYYTDWDFDERIVTNYYKTINEIPIDYVEIGYRNKPADKYYGQYFYCPVSTLKIAKQYLNNKKIAVMLDVKKTAIEDLEYLLGPCVGLVDLVRLAVAPEAIVFALSLADKIHKMGFEVALNVMYMSKWLSNPEFMSNLKKINASIRFLNLVDSYGGIYPDTVESIIREVRAITEAPLGFHGHNNLELALANTIMAIQHGCEIVDSTITGMGRGAGNLKTELLLACLDSNQVANLNYNHLSKLVYNFTEMQSKYNWGTNLPYIISGAYSLPQSEVMSWISKKRYTTRSIINTLQNQKEPQPNNGQVPLLKIASPESCPIVIVGGGENTQKHAPALADFCRIHPTAIIIHAGTRFLSTFSKLPNPQYVCLLGAEGFKLKHHLSSIDISKYVFVLEPSPRPMGTVIPEDVLGWTVELKEFSLFSQYPDSLLTIALELSELLNASDIYLHGLDGYDLKKDNQMLEVAQENQFLINEYTQMKGQQLIALTPTSYQNVQEKSIYSYL